MPPWVAFAPRSTSLWSGKGIDRFSTSILRCRHAAIRAPSVWSFRSASAHVSPTLINAAASIPSRNEELYKALSELDTAAESFVNKSRLQLALQGLEVEDPVVRVAVLSLSGRENAQRIAQLLLADPLGVERQWEKQLQTTNVEDEKPVLLRYGDENDAHSPSPLFQALSIPSRTLQTHNLEVLVSTLNTHVSSVSPASTLDDSKDAILVPKLQAPSVRGGPAPYPVHKSLVLGDGIESAVAYGRFTSENIDTAGDIVKVVINVSTILDETDTPEESTCLLVNIDTGAEALGSFRKSVANSEHYEQGWYKSGMHSLSHWLTQDLQLLDGHLKPTVKRLVESVVEDTEASILRENTLDLGKYAASSTPQATRESILEHLDSWAEKGHTELRDQLDKAFSAQNWHKISWWKLLWRVDDVGMITSEILERRWLVDAEKSGIYLAGRMNQAGFPGEIRIYPSNTTSQNSPQSNQTHSSSTPPPTSEEGPMNVSTDVRISTPWPTQISASRTQLIRETVPPLQALAQRLVLTTMSTTSLAAALSTLFYVSLQGFGVFESGAIAALGLVYSLRRMQKLWESARDGWQEEVREEGRRTLKVVEDGVRELVTGFQRPVVKGGAVEERRKARGAIKRAREALEKL
ncbi:hypothetical protein BCR34DRAFT_578119 [Clohesyomyces aquaticus]|uniref:Mmc1 C-terminal domain-containing protein n=1 Tax=Clohesyomyces aquaticus TaxID=1231657 RepID=A0A1Y1YGN9_9PLEO|nr:hypothetical protein BCR34DRAFT_578119 [Clohesyomyces aquaticus]